MINPIAKDWLDTIGALAEEAVRPGIKRKEYADLLASFERRAAALQGVPEAGGLLERARVLCGEATDVAELRREAVADGIATLPVLREARLFDLSPEIQRACGAKSNEMIGEPDLSALPFPVCWFGVRQWAIDHAKGEAPIAQSVALVATRSGLTAYVMTDASGNDPIVLPTQAINEDGWDAGALQSAWAAYLMAAVVNGSVAERPDRGGYAMQRALARLRDRGVVLRPPDLYTLTLTARQAAQRVRLAAEAHSGPAYRYEVRQHERMLVHRGRWPCGHELHEDFAKRGYVVERGDGLSECAALGLSLRGLPAGERGEWIAWRFAKVREHEAGPKDAPVKRAVRAVGGGR